MSVLMFHSIGCENENWYRTWLSISLNHFDNFCKFLVKNDYETVFLDEYYSSSYTSKANRDKQVVITFDDGYLDNWVYAYPILKKYNLKGTIFINPEFLDNSIETRHNLFDVWENKIEIQELKPLGFLNWTELKSMQAEGVMDIQSHSMSHNFYFSSNSIKDIYTGQSNYDWLAWVAKPERKPLYATEDQTGFVAKGTPIFEFGRALALKRYFPDERLIELSVESFRSNNNSQATKILIKELLNKYPGHYETDEEQEKRYRYELFESKNIIEERLQKPVNYLCWPGGGYNFKSIKLSIEADYKGSTISKKSINISEIQARAEYQKIKRYAMTSFISTSKGNYYVNNANYLVSLFKSHEGDFFSRRLYLARKLGFMIKEKLVY